MRMGTVSSVLALVPWGVELLEYLDIFCFS
jgi:hypothetical protein